ncbi:hypothetical protein BYT27DRAFT_7250980 [Phlegmacium glaucopus]|nr:hypothetical protein BYT27DRAFT_7250980 [Phlegmacium glaucopus]
MPARHVDWKKLFYVIFGCIVLVGGSAFVSLIALPTGVNDTTVLEQLPNKDGIFFLGHVYKVNVSDRTISVSWLVGGCGNLRLQRASNFTDSKCGLANVSFDVYVDGALFTESQFHYDPTIHPIGNPPMNNTIYVQALNQFQYTHTMDISSAELRNHRPFEQRYFYPFEKYRLVTTFIAFNPAANTSLPIVRLAISDTVNNFQPQLDEWETQTFVNNTLMNSRTTHVNIQRTISAKTFVILIFTSNWIITAAVMYITCIALWSNTKLGDGVVLLPMTIILTLPLLRQFYVDAPPIGVLLDSLGLILQMFLVAICGIVLLLNANKVKDKQPPRPLNLKLKDYDDFTTQSYTLLPFRR